MKKIGDIVVNHWAGKGNPTKVSIYIGKNTTLSFIGGKFEKSKYPKDVIDAFMVIGHSTLIDELKEKLKALAETDKLV